LDHFIAVAQFFSAFEEEEEFLLLFVLGDGCGLKEFIKVGLPFALGFFLNFP